MYGLGANEPACNPLVTSLSQMTLYLQRLLIFKLPLVFLGDFQTTHLLLAYQMSLVILLERTPALSRIKLMILLSMELQKWLFSVSCQYKSNYTCAIT